MDDQWTRELDRYKDDSLKLGEKLRKKNSLTPIDPARIKSDGSIFVRRRDLVLHAEKLWIVENTTVAGAYITLYETVGNSSRYSTVISEQIPSFLVVGVDKTVTFSGNKTWVEWDDSSRPTKSVPAPREIRPEKVVADDEIDPPESVVKIVTKAASAAANDISRPK